MDWNELNPVVTFANLLNCPSEFSFGPRKVIDHQLIYVVSGRGKACIEGRNYQAKQGDLFYYGPGITHYFTAESIDPFSLCGLHFIPDGDLLENGGMVWPRITDGTWEDMVGKENLLRIGSDDGTMLSLSDYIYIGGAMPEELLKQVVQQYDNKDSITPIWNKALLMLFLIKIKKYVDESAARSSRDFQTAEFVRIQLQKHACLSYDRRWLHEWTNYHQDYTARIFLRHFNTSPHNYHLKQKIQRAQQMLGTTELTVSEIADQLHFSTVHYFSRLFKAKTGYSPLAYRDTRRMI